MSGQAGDGTILKHIQDLAAEEERLYGQARITEADRTRLKAIGVELDQCWDLLRQRRALREFGMNPEEAKLRPPDVVEKYEG
ncbi:MAG: DUF2630 family protein [Rhodospirillales bacterium]|nr:DUF2630 family protein [Rhodospirillales bacterium]